jgi:small-conductance mechanosensitive channel
MAGETTASTTSTEETTTAVSTDQITETLQNIDVGSFVAAVVILAVAAMLATWVRRRLRKYLRPQDGLDQGLAESIARVASWGVVLVGVILAVGALGFDTSPLLLVILIIVIAAFLMGRGVMENFTAGILLQMRGPFRVGDRIETKDYDGHVVEITSRSVRIETGDLRMVHVPNADFLDDPIVTYTANPVRRSSLDIGVSYDADLGEAKRLLARAAADCEGVHDDPPARALITGFGDSAVDIVIHFWHDDGERWQVRDRVAEATKAALDEAGIDIPFPHQVNLEPGASSDAE